MQVSLTRVVAAMTKKVKSMKRDLEKEEAIFKTHAHRVIRSGREFPDLFERLEDFFCLAIAFD